MRAFSNCLVLCLSAALALQAASRTDYTWTTVRGSSSSDSSITHDAKKSLRVEPGGGNSDAAVRSATLNLGIGKTYELTGWVRTQDLTVHDLVRSPISQGAALTMASMPFDVHSASLAGTRDWTKLALRFVATKAQDQILLTAGRGGVFKGKAWFEGVTLDEASTVDSWPSQDAVQAFGPAYRYPAAGWIYLHIEGKPYDRGYQHGYLMAHEIPEYLKRCAYDLGAKPDRWRWDPYRNAANALFLRGFDKEILEEMKGIADGANAAGARWLDRKIELSDIVLLNTEVEMNELAGALRKTPIGLEGLHFDAPKHDAVTEHCSAFAATGAATRDGKMVIGHVTWWPQTLAEQTNIMLDIKPETGHRVLMQSYPGGIESGTDWYQNDAGVVLTETTIEQTPFNAQGTPVAFRARMAAQYGGNIDEVVQQLGTRNNGLYTNEWLIGDAKTNEIAMYELGTNHTRLWRSSKDEWFNGTTGFYWGNNNAKDMSVKLEYAPDPQGAPQFLPFVPAVRDEAWQAMYREYKGQIDEQFAFKAFDSAPLVSRTTMDAKVVTSDMARHMMVWGAFGRPNESVWNPAEQDAGGPNHGLYPGGYYLFDVGNEGARTGAKRPAEAKKPKLVSWKDRSDQLWKGWLLPASDADTWFVAGSTAYYQTLQSEDVEKVVNATRVRYRGMTLTASSPPNRVLFAAIQGELFLDGLRHKLGDEAFLKLMTDYYAANTTKTVTAQSFLDFAKTSFTVPDPGDGPAYLASDIQTRLDNAVIVYGTAREAGANRYAAEELKTRYRDRTQREVPVYRDFEVTGALLAHKDVIFIGRPETNSALAAWGEKIGLDYPAGAFKLDGHTYASERNALVYAATNPIDATHMVVVYAGNSPLETARALDVDAAEPAFALEDANPAR